MVFVGFDSYYHMRRILLIVADFPNYISTDSYMYFPKGAWIGWLPLYDQTVALFAMIFGLGSPSIHTIETVGAAFPAFLGAFTIFPLYYVSKEIFDKKIGLISAVILAITPAHVHISQLGFCDHHVAEIFLFTTMMAFFIMALKKGPIFSVLSGFVASLILLMWTGALLYLGAIVIYVVVQYVYDLYMEKSPKFLTLISISMFATVILIVTPIASFMVHWYQRSLYTQLMILTAFIGFFIILGIISVFILKKEAKWYWLPISIAALSAPIFFGLQTIALPQYQFVTGRFRYLTGGYIPGILEAESWKMSALVDQFTTTIFIGLIAFILFVLLRFSKIKDTKNSEILFIVLTIIAFALAIFQRRFSYFLSVSISIVTAYAFFKALEILKIDLNIFSKKNEKKKTNKKKKRKKEVKFSDLGLTQKMEILLPLAFVIIIFFVPNLYVAIAKTVEIPGIIYYDFDESLRWMDQNTPKTSYYNNPSDPKKTPEYGVMSWWDNGNWILYVAKRPVISNNFQWGVEESAHFFIAQDEQSASKILDDTKVRYVLTDYRMGYYYRETNTGEIAFGGKFENMAKIAGMDPKEYYHKSETDISPSQKYYNTVYTRLHLFDGSRNKASVNVTSLNHYRLIYESNKTAYKFGEEEIKLVKIFEFVPGAKIIGRVGPNENVTISVDVKTNQGRIFDYSNVVTSNKDGFFEIVVPYATTGTPYDTKPVGSYIVVTEDGSLNVEIDEQDILGGAEVLI